VIIRYLDIERITVLPSKTDPVLIVDSNAPLTFSVAMQSL